MTKQFSDVECKEIAQTIYQQLGGAKFGIMVGAKNLGFIRTDEGVAFVCKFMKNKSGMTNLKVIYDYGKDLYNMVFYSVRFSKKTFETTTKEKRFDGIFCDQLTEIFENFTGLYTSL